MFVPFLAAIIISCSSHEAVSEYFQEHGLTYPVDSSGLGVLGVEYVGIDDEEIFADGARDFVENGIIFIKDYYRKHEAGLIIRGAEAVLIEDPVLYRGEKGEVGIMVRVSVFGTGSPDKEVKGEFSFLGPEQAMWKAQNFAYFIRNEFYKWQFGGMVY